MVIFIFVLLDPLLKSLRELEHGRQQAPLHVRPSYFRNNTKSIVVWTCTLKSRDVGFLPTLLGVLTLSSECKRILFQINLKPLKVCNSLNFPLFIFSHLLTKRQTTRNKTRRIEPLHLVNCERFLLVNVTCDGLTNTRGTPTCEKLWLMCKCTMQTDSNSWNRVLCCSWFLCSPSSWVVVRAYLARTSTYVHRKLLNCFSSDTISSWSTR